MKRYSKQRFTLAEILVAMVVFSILLVLMMQFFSGARTLWIANEKRSNLYADATVAMDLMSTLLQTTFYNQEGGTPFAIRNVPKENEARSVTGWDSKIYFVSNSPLALSKGGSVRYLSFQRGSDAAAPENNVLWLKVFSDSSKSIEMNGPPFDQFFNPIGPDVAVNNNPNDDLDEARTQLIKELNGRPGDDERKPILRNVTGLKFTPINHEGKKLELAGSSDCNYLPAGIEIEISLMQNETMIQTWQSLSNDAAKNDFRTKNEQTFRRTVWLGERTYKIYE